MPKYYFRNKETGEEFSETMGISAQEIYLQENPHLESFPGNAGTPFEPGVATGLHSGRGLGGGVHHDNGFNDILKNIQKGSGRDNSIHLK